jgi:hypothetical protein
LLKMIITTQIRSTVKYITKKHKTVHISHAK